MSVRAMLVARGWASLLVIGLLGCGAAAADQQTGPLAERQADVKPFKLTLGSYWLSSGGSGTDINLRHGSTLGNLWLGYFDSAKAGVHQWRTGWDRTFGEGIRITPSLQLASQDFAGGSVQIEAGNPWFAGAGIGRTNLKPYWNLNFDPNDSFMLSFGHRSDSGQTLALQYIRDNRQNPDQRHLHFYWRQSLANRQRLTVDLLYKQGLVDDGMIRRWGASIAYDWPSIFLRVAYDPKANFGSDNLWRFSVGSRF